MLTQNDKDDIIENLYKLDIVKDKTFSLGRFYNGHLTFPIEIDNVFPSVVNNMIMVDLVLKYEPGKDGLTPEEEALISKEYNKSKPQFEIQNQIYGCNIHFRGKDDKGIVYICGWHLDYEPRVKYEPLNSLFTNAHPLFHLHYGGAELRSVYRDLSSHTDILDKNSFYSSLIEEIKGIIKDDETKNQIDDIYLKHCIRREEFVDKAVSGISDTSNQKISYIPLLLPSPRFPMPPMDEYLTIDFIISNFYGKDKYEAFRTNSFFRNKIVKSQNTMWKNYYDIIMAYWLKRPTNILPYMLNPSLI